MSTRQYIGARYVPKFANPLAWVSGASYEALTIVTYLNNSYTSKKPVPATIGNPAENPEYWVATGNYNAQIEEYRKTTEEYRQETEVYKQDVDTYKGETDTKFTAIEGEIDSLRNKRYILIGDSYSTVNDNAFPNTFREALGLTENDNFYFSGQGGAGWVGSVNGNTFLARLQAIESIVTNKDTITDIIVCGGVNDGSYTYSDVTFGMKNFKDYVESNYPKAKVSIGFISRCKTAGTIYNLYDEILYAYKTCGSAGWGYIEGSTDWLQYSEIADDGLHPNVYGSKWLGWCLANWCIGKSSFPRLLQKEIYTGTFDQTGITSTSGLTVEVEKIGDLFRCALSNAIISFANNTSASLKDGVKVCSFSQGRINSISYNKGALHGTCMIRYTVESNDTWVAVPCDIMIRLDGLYVKAVPPYQIADSTVNALWFTGAIEGYLSPNYC